MSQYCQYYKKAIELIKKGKEPNIENVMNSKFPATDFGIARIHSAQKAIETAKSDAYVAAVKSHPRWHNAVIQNKSASECLKIWIEEGGSSYLQIL